LKDGVSIIICCYNSELLIEQTLRHIASQNLGINLPCEVILVDNASTDRTQETAWSVWSKMPANKINLIVTQEPTPGLTYARQKGINEANYEYLIFCDDDNWLDENYVQNTFNLFKLNANVAVLGGFGVAQFEDPVSKPAWFDSFYHGYAVGPQADEESTVNGVYGAGMAVRKSVLMTVMSHPMFLHDRKQNQLTSGGDGEICYRILFAGYQVLYSPQLTFKHFLTTRRLTWDYLKRLYIGLSKGAVVISLYQKALNSDGKVLPLFYWLKKGLYYWGIYLKYWPKHYSVYKNGEGSTEEIHHLIWKSIAMDYFKYNFETNKMYREMIALKNGTFKKVKV
jgi:glycosyltransferase involved in cell wall biosynthesis